MPELMTIGIIAGASLLIFGGGIGTAMKVLRGRKKSDD
jgi:hypothetical protein